MEAGAVYADEGTSVQLCTVLTGVLDETTEDIALALNFIDSSFTGIIILAKPLHEIKVQLSILNTVR